MNSLNDDQNELVATKRLERAITVAKGEFSLILACCNSLNKQQQIVNILKKSLSEDIAEIFLLPNAETLYTTITNSLDKTQPAGIMIRGLESVTNINQLLISTNIMRDEFRKNFHFPLVLWVNDEIISQLVWLAPDLKNWAASTIRFETSLIEQPILSV